MPTCETNGVDGHGVPVRHFGLILEWEEWHGMAERVAAAGVEFVIEPYIRFEGQPGEQATMFFYDPSGNALEFKSFKDPNAIFATGLAALCLPRCAVSADGAIPHRPPRLFGTGSRFDGLR